MFCDWATTGAGDGVGAPEGTEGGGSGADATGAFGTGAEGAAGGRWAIDPVGAGSTLDAVAPRKGLEKGFSAKRLESPAQAAADKASALTPASRANRHP
jgi:hypothetical protein